MTSRWRWLTVPAGGAVLYLALRLGLDGKPEAVLWTNRLVPGAFLTLGSIGATLAAVQFKRGDYLRPAWGLIGFGFLCIAVSRLLSGPHPPYELRLALTIGSNAAQIAGTWLLSRTWQVAGLELPRGRAGVYGTAIFFAVIVAGVPLVANIHEVVATGRFTAWHGIVSSLGDGITFVLLAPITLTAITLRGGLTGWPWVFFAASILCWLIYDLRDVVLLFTSGENPQWVTIAVEPFRVAASGFVFAAGMAQRWLAKHETG